MLALAAAASAQTQTQTQTVPFDYSVNDGVTFPVIQGFDTFGGARDLQSVTFEFRHNFAVEMFWESTGPTPVRDGDFSLDLSFITLFQLGEADDENSPPLFGTGALFVGGVSGDLGSYDGIPGNDGVDSFRRSFTDSFVVAQAYTDVEPEVLAAVTDVGAITTVMGGFTELFFVWINDPGWPFPPGGVPEYPTDAALWVSTPTFRHHGEIVVTYEFVDVPEPASLASLAAVALFAALRRR